MTGSRPYLPFTYRSSDPLTEQFWKAAERRELAFQRCSDCKAFRHPPAPLCSKCHSFNWEFAPVAGRGTIFTFVVVHHPLMPSLTEHVPYNVSVVEFPDAPEVRFITNVVGTPLEEICVGMPVEVIFEELGEGRVVPRVKAAED